MEEVGDDQNETHGETALEGCVDDGLGSDLEIQILNFLKNKKCLYFPKLARLQMRAHKLLCDPKQLSCGGQVKAGKAQDGTSSNRPKVGTASNICDKQQQNCGNIFHCHC